MVPWADFKGTFIDLHSTLSLCLRISLTAIWGNSIIYFCQSLGSWYYLCSLSDVRVDDPHLSVLFISQFYAAAAEVWDYWCLSLRVISGLLYITEQDCLREFFGGLWETDKGLAVMLWSIGVGGGGGWTDVISCSWQGSDTHLLWPRWPQLNEAALYFSVKVSAIEHGVKKSNQIKQNKKESWEVHYLSRSFQQ